MSDKYEFLIDGGYFKYLIKNEFHNCRIDYSKFVNNIISRIDDAVLMRAKYYDCLPYCSKEITLEEQRRHEKSVSFFNALKRLDKFDVVLGKLECRGIDKTGKKIFVQKRVDVELAVDICREKNNLYGVVLLAGDSDFIPAIKAAKDLGKVIILLHGEQNCYHQELWDACDSRIKITQEIINNSLMEKNH